MSGGRKSSSTNKSHSLLAKKDSNARDVSSKGLRCPEFNGLCHKLPLYVELDYVEATCVAELVDYMTKPAVAASSFVARAGRVGLRGV